MTTVDDFAQGMLREYNTFARQCVALVAEVGDEDRAADCFAMEDLPGVAERLGALRARAEAAERERAECHKQLDELEGILSDTLAARARAETEAERLRSAIAETLRLAGIYAGVAAHNAEAEPETAGEAWRSPYMATMRELRRALGGAA